MSGQHRRRVGLPIKRDGLTFAFGLAGLGWMIHSGNAPWPLVIACMFLSAAPAGERLLKAARGTAGPEATEPTTDSSSPGRSRLSSPTSSSTSSPTGADQ